MKAKLDSAEHKELVDKLEELANSIEGGQLSSSYSGRAMWGALCYSIDADDDVEALMKVGEMGLPKPKMDSMGMGVVLYWPDIEGCEPDRHST